MKNVFLSIGLLFTSSVSFAAIDQTCWDGTFKYDSVRVLETERGIEWSVMGMSLTKNSNDILSLSLSWSIPSVHMLFKPEQCQMQGETLSCASKSNVWFSYDVFDIDAIQQIITGLDFVDVHASLSKDEMKLKLSDTSVSFKCLFDHADDQLRFPERLIQHIEKNSK